MCLCVFFILFVTFLILYLAEREDVDGTPDPVDPVDPFSQPVEWLLAATGSCENMTMVADEWTRDLDGVTFVGNISFYFYTSTLMAFTDMPTHRSHVVQPDKDEVEVLSSPYRYNKNIAVTADHGGSYTTAVYHVDTHEPCPVKEGAQDCVYYTGFVSNHTTSFAAPGVGTAGSCQLFVDDKSACKMNVKKPTNAPKDLPVGSGMACTTTPTEMKLTGASPTTSENNSTSYCYSTVQCFGFSDPWICVWPSSTTTPTLSIAKYPGVHGTADSYNSGYCTQQPSTTTDSCALNFKPLSGTTCTTTRSTLIAQGESASDGPRCMMTFSCTVGTTTSNYACAFSGPITPGDKGSIPLSMVLNGDNLKFPTDNSCNMGTYGPY